MSRQFDVRLRASLCLIALLMITGCNGSWSVWRNDGQTIGTDNLKNPTRLHLTYAQLNEQTGDVEKARNSYNNALEYNERSVEAVLGLARLDLLADRPHQAEQGFLKAIRLAPNDSRVAEAAGQFYITQDRFKEAARHLLKGVELNPTDKRLRHRLGLALARQGEIAAAEPHFIQAVGAAEADYNIGLILYEQGDIDSAEQRFFQASLKKPQLAQAQHWLDTVRQERANRQNMAARQRQAVSRLGNRSNVPQAPQPILDSRIAQRDVRLQGGTRQPMGGEFEKLQSIRGLPSTSPITQPQVSTFNRLRQNGSTIAAVNRQGLGTATVQPLNPTTMTATQLEQLENSMTPAERERFRMQMQNR
jgi:tetratricopeptide (TPR) repeat protein